MGKAGAVLASAIVALGAGMSLYSVRAGYASGRPNMASLLVNALIDLVLFCLFFVAGLFFPAKKGDT